MVGSALSVGGRSGCCGDDVSPSANAAIGMELRGVMEATAVIVHIIIFTSSSSPHHHLHHIIILITSSSSHHHHHHHFRHCLHGCHRHLHSSFSVTAGDDDDGDDNEDVDGRGDDSADGRRWR